jgi:hypothetical protein
MELGGNALHRYATNPHVKYDVYRKVVRPAYKQWFAFGYGLDSGLRYSPSREGMTAAVEATNATPQNIEDDPHMALFEARSWLDVDGDPQGDLPFFLRGLGVGMGADGRLDDLEAELLAQADPLERRELLVGLGASLGSGLSTLSALPNGSPSAGVLLPADWEQLARGALAVGAASPGDLGAKLSWLGMEERAAFERGLQALPVPDLSAMMRVPMVPTPQPPPPTVF